VCLNINVPPPHVLTGYKIIVLKSGVIRYNREKNIFLVVRSVKTKPCAHAASILKRIDPIVLAPHGGSV
jgi:hypothetical protein